MPEADRPLWSRYMIDYCPSFPGGMLMSAIDNSVKDITTRIPQVWKQTAAELHSAGFTPLRYYLLAELLADLRERNKLNQAAHGRLFRQWFKDPVPAFQLKAEGWKPWLERLNRAESPSRALDYVLHDADVPRLGRRRTNQRRRLSGPRYSESSPILNTGANPGTSISQYTELRERNRLLEQENEALRRAAGDVTQAHRPGSELTDRDWARR